MAASILLAFDRNRTLPIDQIPGAVVITHNERARGAAYDYGPGGVTLDRSSVARESALDAFAELYGMRRQEPTPAPIPDGACCGGYCGQEPTVPTLPKKSEPLSAWDRLLTLEDLV